MKYLKLYWSRGLKDGRPNFGDWLSPLLCETLSGLTIRYARPNRCDLMAVGSILHRVGHSWFNRKIHIWGTGLMAERAPFTSRHYYHALRGRKTAACILHHSTPVYGDPGLLCNLLLPDLPRKQHPLGLIPHYKDQDNPLLRDFLARHPQAVLIDVLSQPRQVIEKIAQCEVVLSSSLHGLAAADSLAVPNGWIRLSDLVRGNDFKFHDYYSAFGIAPQPFDLTAGTSIDEVLTLAADYRRPGLQKIQADLIAAFPFRR